MSSERNSLKDSYKSDFNQLGILGAGGFAIVFKAQKKLDKATYAVKRVLSEDDSALDEVLLLAELNHSNVIRYFNAWEEEVPAESLRKQDELLIPDDADRSLRSAFRRHWGAASGSEADQTAQLGVNFGQLSVANNGEVDQKRDLHISSLKDQAATGMTVQERTDTEQGQRGKNGTVRLLYIQLELCSNTLRQWFSERNEFDRTVAFDIFRQVNNGLEYLHQKNYIHWDLKPSNILFALECNKNIRVVIADYGLARQPRKKSLSNSEVPARDAVTVAAESSSEQSSEEQSTSESKPPAYVCQSSTNGEINLEALSYGQRQDLYACGLILLELLANYNLKDGEWRKVQTLAIDHKQFPRNISETDRLLLQDLLNVDQPLTATDLLGRDPLRYCECCSVRNK